MEAKEIQRKIISTCIGEDQYHQVRFLKPDDFVNYKNHPFRDLYKTIQEVDGNIRKLSKEVLSWMDLHASVSDYSNLKLLGCMLIESNLKESFERLILDIMEKSTDQGEIAVILKSKREIEGVDIFESIEHLPIYLKEFISANSYNRLISFQKGVDQRMKTIKNEL